MSIDNGLETTNLGLGRRREYEKNIQRNNAYAYAARSTNKSAKLLSLYLSKLILYFTQNTLKVMQYYEILLRSLRSPLSTLDHRVRIARGVHT